MEQTRTAGDVAAKAGLNRSFSRTMDAVVVESGSDFSVPPKVEGSAFAMAAVQRYVEAERQRTRRILLWSISGFLVVLATVVAACAALSIVVIRQTRKANEMANGMKAQLALSGTAITGMSDKVSQLQVLQEQFRGLLEDGESQRLEDVREVRTGLEALGSWVTTNREMAAAQMETIRKRYDDMEAGLTARQKELAVLRKQYDALESMLATALPSVQAYALLATEPWGVGGRPASHALSGGPSVSPREVTVVTFPNGGRYEGELRNGLFHGWGVYTYPQGDRYEGQFADDVKTGTGTYVYAAGDVYVGEFRDDVKAGRGTITFQNGDHYTGVFANDKYDGQGAISYQNGNQYTGGFRQGVKYGTGCFKFANGDRYTGDFQGDERHGQGLYEFRDGSRYEGTFVHGRRHGNGRYRYASGEEYVGEFKEGRKEGIGVCVYPNGVKAKGLWQADKFVKAIAD